MKNVFLDLGSNKGKILRRFIMSPLYSPDFEMHAFEASPLMYGRFWKRYPPNVKIHHQAVWTENGLIDFYVNPQKPKGVASTALTGKLTGHLDHKHPRKIPAIDFSAWLAKTFQPEDNIICKCDIEGAEYPVFEKMVADGTIRYIKRLYMERHWKKFNWPKEKDDAFVKIIHATGLKIESDYSEFK